MASDEEPAGAGAGPVGVPGFSMERALARLERADPECGEVQEACEQVRAAWRSALVDAERLQSELCRVREGLVRAEQMATLGGLVAGVAHEVSTPVGITLTAASHLADQTGRLRVSLAGGRLRKADFDEYIAIATEAAGLIESNARRAADLIQGFKQVAVDQTTAERRRFKLGGYLEEVVLSLSPRLRRAGHRVSIHCPGALEIDGFPGAISQVVTNLAMNSLIHGYGPGEHGHITIEVREDGDDSVEITYADDGKGIPLSYRERIFDPFFTTRRGEGGSGLGLYIVNSIVTKTLKGTITLEEQERGAVFRIRFLRAAVAPPGPAA